MSEITFEIAEGGVIYVLGESGSGKSTLLKIIAGLEDSDHGSVSVGNEIITGPSQNLVPGYDSIAHVAQDFKLQQFWTVRDNIGKKISHYSKVDKEERIRELLALCKLESHADRFPKELSGGQQQRIAIVAAIADEPDVVLLDEPFSNLDLPMKSEVRKEIISMLRALGITVMLISHDPAEALAVANSIILLRDGKLEQMGTPEEVYRNPISFYAAKFLGPVNELSVNKKNELIRPEDIRIVSSGLYEGQIESTTFMGMHYQVYISSKLSSKALLAYSSEALKRGQSVRFSIA